MNKPILSIVMPGIRPWNWLRGFKTIDTKVSFELIIVSPNELPKELLEYRNIKYVRDFGSPSRASQIGNLLAEGKFIFPNFCDDAGFIPNAIDQNLELLMSMGNNIKNVVTCKYSESPGFSHPTRYQDDNYYRMVNAYPVGKDTPQEWWILNNPFWYREYFEMLGGYDCSFSSTPITHADLGMRAYNDGAHVQLSPFPIMQVDHGQSDHQPIEIAQLGYDSPAFSQKYYTRYSPTATRIPMDNWKRAESIWSLRFAL